MNKKILGFIGGIAAGTAVNHFLDEGLVGPWGKGLAVSAAASTIAIGAWCMSAPKATQAIIAPSDISGLGDLPIRGRTIQRSLVDEKLAEIMAAKKKNATPLSESEKRNRLKDMLNGAKPKNITG